MRNSFLRLICIFSLFNNESMEPAPLKVSLNERELSDVVKDAEKYLKESRNMDYSVDKQRIDNIPLMDYMQQLFVKLEDEYVSYFKWLFTFQSLGDVLTKALQKSIFDTKAIQEAVSNTKNIHPTSLEFINALEDIVMMSLCLRKIKYKMNDLLLRIEEEKKGNKYGIAGSLKDIEYIYKEYKKIMTNIQFIDTKDIKDTDNTQLNAVQTRLKEIREDVALIGREVLAVSSQEFMENRSILNEINRIKNNLAELTKEDQICVLSTDKSQYERMEVEVLGNLAQSICLFKANKIDIKKQDPSLMSRLIIKDVKALLGEMTSFPIMRMSRDKLGLYPLMEYITTAGINRSSEQEKIWIAFVDACGKFDIELHRYVLIPWTLLDQNRTFDFYKWDLTFSQREIVLYIRAIEKYLEETRTIEYSNDKQEIHNISIVEYMINMFRMMKALNIAYLDKLISAREVIHTKDNRYIYSLKYLAQNKEFDTKELHLEVGKIRSDISPHILNFISVLEDNIKFRSELKKMTTEIDYFLVKSNWRDIYAARENYHYLHSKCLEDKLEAIEKGVIPFSDTGHEAEEHMKKIRHYLSRISSSNVIYIMKIIEEHLNIIKLPKDDNKVSSEYKSLAKEISNKYEEYISIFSAQKEKCEKERSKPSLLSESTLKDMKCTLQQMIQMADTMTEKAIRDNDKYDIFNNLHSEFKKITKDSESQELKAVWKAFKTEVTRLNNTCDI